MDNNTVRICMLIQGIITEVVRKYLEFQIQPQSFPAFLSSHQHLLYHLWCYKGRCCSCGLPKQSPSHQVLHQNQFLKLFNQQGNACGRNCRCVYTANPNITVVEIDITLCTTILYNCCGGKFSNSTENALREIRDARNASSHSKNDNLTIAEFKTEWNRITNAGKILANCIGRQYFEDVEDRMIRLEHCPILATDYTETYRRLAEEKDDLNTNLHNIDERLFKMENRLVGNVDTCTVEMNVNNVKTVFKNCFFLSTNVTCDSTMTDDRPKSEEKPKQTHQIPLGINVADSPPLGVSLSTIDDASTPRGGEMLQIVPYTETTDMFSTNERRLVSVGRENALQTVTEYTSQISDEEYSTALIPLYEQDEEATQHFQEEYWDDSLLHDTIYKEVAVDPPLLESDTRYIATYNTIEKMRTGGRNNFLLAINYCLLTYIMIRGSSSVNKIDLDILQRIFGLIHDFEIELQSRNLRRYLEDLSIDYLDRIGNIFTIRDMTITIALQNSFGYSFPDSFVEMCNGDILLNHVRPVVNDYEHSNDIVRIDPETLIDALIQKLQNKTHALSVGEYLHVMHEHDMAGEFCEKFNQCDIDISVISIVEFLDGLTQSGKVFTLFECIEELYDVLYRRVDDGGNTVMHYMVATVNENERFLLYIEYFCEHKFGVMKHCNNYKQNPTDIAAYLGRYEVIDSVLDRCSDSKREDTFSEIFAMLQEGVELYKSSSSGSSQHTECIIDTMGFTIYFGEIEDYEKILKLIGKEKELKLTDFKCESSEDDISASIGKKVVGIVKDVKKGLNAFTKIPALVKTVNKVTELIED